MTLDALDKALDFIKNNNVKEPDRIDYITYLTGYFVFNAGNLSSETANKLVAWYNNVDFTNQSNTGRRVIFTKLIQIK